MKRILCPPVIQEALNSFTGKSHIFDSLNAIGIQIPEYHKTFITGDRDWKRLGGETFVFRIFIINPEFRLGIVMKACVAGFPVSCTMSDWLDRRNFLNNHGISTPVLYAHDKATLIEEYIPNTLSSILKSPNPLKNKSITQQLSNLAQILDDEGFRPLKLIPDLRSRGNDVVVVDFGFDLGPPGSSVAKEKAAQRLLNQELLKINPNQTPLLEGI